MPTSTLVRTLTSFLCFLSLPTASLTQHRSRDSISIQGLDPRKAQISLLFKETPKRSSPDLKDNSGALSALSGLGKPGKAQAWGSRKGLGTSPVLMPFCESRYGTGVGRPRPPELWVEHQKRLACGGDGGGGFTSILQLIKGLQAGLACRALG